VKNTFIHYDDKSSLDDEDDSSSLDVETNSGASLKRSSSAPCLLMQNPVFEPISREAQNPVFEMISPEVEEIVQEPTELEMMRPLYEMQLAHDSGTCHPCAYFYQKEDSCRLGMECKFCHICPPEAVKQHKKEKLKARRREQARRRGYWISGYRYNEKWA